MPGTSTHSSQWCLQGVGLGPVCGQCAQQGIALTVLSSVAVRAGVFADPLSVLTSHQLSVTEGKEHTLGTTLGSNLSSFSCWLDDLGQIPPS